MSHGGRCSLTVACTMIRPWSSPARAWLLASPRLQSWRHCPHSTCSTCRAVVSTGGCACLAKVRHDSPHLWSMPNTSPPRDLHMVPIISCRRLLPETSTSTRADSRVSERVPLQTQSKQCRTSYTTNDQHVPSPSMCHSALCDLNLPSNPSHIHKTRPGNML